MAKMVISLVLEETEENLTLIQRSIIEHYGKAITGYSANKIEEPKKELKVFLPFNGNRKPYIM